MKITKKTFLAEDMKTFVFGYMKTFGLGQEAFLERFIVKPCECKSYKCRGFSLLTKEFAKKMHNYNDDQIKAFTELCKMALNDNSNFIELV